MNIDKDYREFLRRVVRVLKAQNVRIASEMDIPRKSNLIRSFQVKVRPDFRRIQFFAFDYLEYVNSGRRAGARKVPINALLDWITRYNITAPNKTPVQLAFAIQQNIYKNGIEPKPVLREMQESMVDTIADGMARELEKSIADEFVAQFKV